MNYTYNEIKENTDAILYQSIDVVSLYNSFRKILSKLPLEDQTLHYHLTHSNFDRNDNFSSKIYDFVVALGYLVTTKANLEKVSEEIRKQIQDANDQINQLNIEAFDQVLANLKLKESLHQIAKDLFGFIRIDGMAKDLILLVDGLDIFDAKTKELIGSTTLILAPVNGCDLPF